MTQPVEDSRYRYYVSLWLPAAVVGALLVFVLIIQLALSWVSHTQLQPVNHHMAQMHRLQAVNLELQRKLLESLKSGIDFSSAERQEIRNEIRSIIDMQAQLSDDTPRLLASAHAALADANLHPRDALILALSQLRAVLDRESGAHQQLIDAVNRATAMELRVGVSALVLFPASAIILIFLMRRRILEPLNHLGFLMTLLARRNYAPAPVADVDPMLRPLTDNYNAMVVRLEELESDHARREQDLEIQVEHATRVLLDQQRSLANAERLAAVGEMLARIAHELRNPLAGVKMACTNLRQDLSQHNELPEYAERINIVAGEVDRIIALLNSLLDQSRHEPELPRELAVARVVADLVVLARYQIPGHIRIDQQVAEDVICRLPDALFRQALLNLLLNACQAIGEDDGTIMIRADTMDSSLRLEVRDDGPGFPADLLETGIRAFLSHRSDGTGLGLSMVQRFARALGGTVTLANVEPHGARVTLTLPCSTGNNA